MPEVELDYSHRDAFESLHMRTQRFGCVVAHRRAGKTVAAIMDLIDSALRCDKPDGRYAYVAPYYAQAKDVVWAYVKKYTGAIPGASANESELRVDLPSGARVRLYGADNYDRMRGLYLDGVVLDEYADQPPQAWREVIRPALADRQGWALFIGTPKGRNAFHDIYQEAVASDDWFAIKLKASETGLIPHEELDALKRQMSANEYRREFECDFDAAVEGAYFAEAIDQARSEKRIGVVPADPLMQYRAFWDLGIADACAIWVAQFVGREIRVLDYYETQGQPLAAHINWLRDKGYGSALCVLPHDAAQRDKVTADRFEDHIRAAGFTVRTVENQGRGAAMKRIEAARRLFPAVWFHQPKVQAGIDALAAYHEKRDEKRGIGLGPNHDWSSHCFTGDTLVQTNQGLVRIDNLPPIGLVLTPCGYRQYRNPRVTRANAQLVEVVFNDGHTVKCTPDHLFATESGWRSAQSLAKGSLILSTSTRSRSISTAVCIGLGQVTNILAGAARSCTAMFGSLLSVIYPRVAISTTGTATRSITELKTSNASMPESILAKRGMIAEKLTRPSIFQPWRGIVPEIGITQMRDACGTSDMLSGLSSGRRIRERRDLARVAASCSWGLIGPQQLLRNIAALPASVRHIVKVASQALMPLRIASVRHLTETADVWDITVPTTECFALANGAVVHNCADAFGLMCVAYEMPTRAAPLKYSNRGIV